MAQKSGATSDYLRKYLESQEKSSSKAKKSNETKQLKTKEKTGLKIIEEESVISVKPKLDTTTYMKLTYKDKIPNFQSFVEDEEDEEDEESKPLVVAVTQEKKSGEGWVELSQDEIKNLDLNQSKKPKNDASQKSDLSPVRRKQDEDLSPVRKKQDEDLSPPRKKKNEDLSPVRRKRVGSDDDLSPVRNKKGDDLSPVRRKRVDSDDDLSPVRKQPKIDDISSQKMSSGSKAGLLNRDELFAESTRIRAERKKKLETTDPEAMGKGAQTVYRDKKGKKLSINEIIRQQEKQMKSEDSDEGMEWGKGLVQTREQEQRLEKLKAATFAPLAVHDDDLELNAVQKDTDRWGDPMLKLKKSKKEKKDKKEKKKKKESSIKLWTIPPLNRYGILPGKYWDGVDRSNGFEKKLLSEKEKKKQKDWKVIYGL